MQPALEYRFDRACLQAVVDFISQIVRRHAAAIIFFQIAEIAVQFLVTEGERARETFVEDQELRHADGSRIPGIEPAEGVLGRDRAQDRLPLNIIELGADKGELG